MQGSISVLIEIPNRSLDTKAQLRIKLEDHLLVIIVNSSVNSELANFVKNMAHQSIASKGIASKGIASKITRRRLWSLGLLLSAGLTVGISACQSNPTGGQTQDTTEAPTDSAESVVNLYSARHYDIDDELYEEFTAETGIQVNVLEGKPDELIERIKNEGEQSPADVFVAVDAGRMWRAQEEGILQPVTSEVLNTAVPENLREPSGEWFSLTKRARVLVYNTDNVQPAELSTYEDLADPKWQGRVCVRSF